MIYEYREHNVDKVPKYAWTDRRRNILRVPDDTWDPVLKSEKGVQLKVFLENEGYDGPSDWNPW